MSLTLRVSLWAAALAALATLAYMSASAPEPSISPAEGAYFEIEANVFSRAELQRAWAKVAVARDANPNDPWVYLSTSLGVLVSGYQIGDWYSLKTFNEGTVDEALTWAEKARASDPRNSLAHAHIARLLIVKGEYEKAWDTLTIAHSLAPDSFYPWYFRGIIAEKMRDVGRASEYFKNAEERVQHKHQLGLVNSHRQYVAQISGDLREQERLLKENIARDPGNAHFLGNYAHFLRRQKRYEESIRYWTTAIAISPYPNAVKQLEEVRRLQAGARK